MTDAPMIVKVKPLVWQEAYDGNHRKGDLYCTRSPVSFAPIAAHRKHDGWWLNVDCKTYHTLEAAKAAAQADYEARILAALDLTPDPRVTALVEAAFCEGFAEGCDGTWIEGDYTPAWNKSKARAALAAFKGDAQ
jgi:hypothetical protein